MIVFSPFNDQTVSCVDNRLERTQMDVARRTQDTVTVTYTVNDVRMDERFRDLESNTLFLSLTTNQ